MIELRRKDRENNKRIFQKISFGDEIGGSEGFLLKKGLSRRIDIISQINKKYRGLSLPNEMQVLEACFLVYETLNSLDCDLDYGD